MAYPHTPRILRIRGWSEHYENNQSRVVKALTWVRLPIKLDGDGYTDLISHANGAAHYGAWVTCVVVAARCNPRGTLVREGGRPHDADSLSRITRIPVKTMAEAIDRLLGIGWLEDASPPSELPPERQEETRGEESRARQEAALTTHSPASAPHEGAATTQDAIAKQLKSRLGSGLNVCRDQVRALVTSGWPLTKVLAAVEEHAEPGLAPWDWTKRATGMANRVAPARNVPNPAEILEVGRKLAQNNHVGLFLKGGSDVA